MASKQAEEYQLPNKVHQELSRPSLKWCLLEEQLTILIPADLVIQNQMLKDLAKNLPYISFKVVIIALTGEPNIGEFAFTNEVSVEPTAKLSELLRQSRN